MVLDQVTGIRRFSEFPSRCPAFRDNDSLLPRHCTGDVSTQGPLDGRHCLRRGSDSITCGKRIAGRRTLKPFRSVHSPELHKKEAFNGNFRIFMASGTCRRNHDRYRIGTVDGLQWTRCGHLRHPWRASFKMEPGSMVKVDFSPRIGSWRRRSLLLGT